MQKTLQQKIDRAKVLLQTIRHACMATVNADGTPHNTPFMFMHGAGLQQLFWGSHPDSLHSQNILRTGQLFVVLYDAQERGGLFLRAVDGHMLEGDELAAALQVHNRLRQNRSQDELPLSYYTGKSPQRMWAARIVNYWVNGTARDANDRIIKDIRTEITAADLLI